MPTFIPHGIALALSLSAPTAERALATSAERAVAKPPSTYLYGMRMVSFSRSPLPKWQEVAARHERQVAADGEIWDRLVSRFAAVDTAELLQTVNGAVNRARYVKDSANWRVQDRWATPQELLTRGGDCEDFAMAKYLILREVGVDPAHMRIAVTRNHAVLIVATQAGPVVLDSGRPEIRPLDARFAKGVVFVVNDQSWALNLGRDGFQLALR